MRILERISYKKGKRGHLLEKKIEIVEVKAKCNTCQGNLMCELIPHPLVDSLHRFRLRAIRAGPFVNVASHFICIKIFHMEISALPLVLSVSKYSRYNYRVGSD